MGDQLIDALVGILPALIRGDQFRIESADALPPLGERCPQTRIFPTESIVRFGQSLDGALESIEVAGFRG